MEGLDLVKMCLLKQGPFRSYDELLLLKSHIVKSEFIKNTLSVTMLPKQVDELCRSLLLEHFSAGEYVFKQNDPGDKMYIILSGSCEVRLRQKVELAHGEFEMREKVLFVCKPGQHFGERALSEDQPRAASILCIEDTDLITISKRIYNLLLKSAHADATSMGGMTEQPGTKPFVLKVLSKRRETRTPLEIESVAGYLNWRIPFFSNFTQEQQLELCRVSEVITIWGRTVLFKQGSIGQAFYVILTGSVDIWVSAYDAKEQLHARGANNGSNGDSDTANLGNKVGTLQMGDIFGERALENADSMRMASIVTCDQQTELLVISREDYHKLVSALMNKQTMQKITCLRKTSIFKNTEMVHLKELAKYMEPRRFELDEVLFREGSKATEMIIIECGECVVEVPIEAYTDATTTEVSGVTFTRAGTKSKRKLVEIGRLGPFSVIAQYITQVNQLHDSLYHAETVTASTLITAYTVSQHDFYSHVSRDERTLIAELIKNHIAHTLPGLWDDAPRIMGEAEFRLGKAWEAYRRNLMLPSGERNEFLTYGSALKAASNLHLTVDSGNALKNKAGARLVTKTNTSSSFTSLSAAATTTAGPTGSSIAVPEIVPDENVTPVDLSWGIKSPKKGRNYLNNLRRDIFSVDPVVQGVINHAASAAMRSTDGQAGKKKKSGLLSVEEKNIPSHQRLGFSLMHVHRENLSADSSNMGARRLLRAHMRLCGTMHSCTDAKEVAEALMNNAFHVLFNCDLARKSQLNLKWKSFAGLEAIPLYHTDIFFVYCRSVPVEYACISPSEDLLTSFEYPASCKQRHQTFACVRMKRLLTAGQIRNAALSKTKADRLDAAQNLVKSKHRRTRRRPRDGSDDEDDDEDSMLPEEERELDKAGLPVSSMEKQRNFTEKLLQPIFLLEIGAFVEIAATAATRIECLRYHKNVVADNTMAGTPAGVLPAALSRQVSSVIDNYQYNSESQAASRPGTSASTSNTASRNDLRTCIIPLYEWFQISEERARALDVENITLSASELVSLGHGVHSHDAASARAEHADPTQVLPQLKRSIMTCFAEMGLKHQATSRFAESSAVVSDPLPINKVSLLGNEASRKELSLAVIKQMEVEEKDRQQLEKELEIKRREKRKKKKPAIPGHPRTSSPPEGSFASLNSLLDDASQHLPQNSEIQSEVDDDEKTFVMTAERDQAMKAVLLKRAEIFQLNDKLCSEENDMSRLAKALARGESTRITDAGNESDDEEEIANAALGDTAGAPNVKKVLTEVEVEEARRKRRNARRGLWESKEASPGMGLVKQRMNVYQKLVSLPTRHEIEAQLLGEGAASVGGKSVRSSKGSVVSSSSAVQGAVPYISPYTNQPVSEAPLINYPQVLRSKLQVVDALVRTATDGWGKGLHQGIRK